MPAEVAGAIIKGGADLIGANQSANASKSAAATSAASTAAALAYTKQKDAQDRSDAITAQNANYAQYTAKLARLAPYLQTGAGASALLQKGLGLPQVALPPNPPPPQFTSTFNPAAAAPAAPGTPGGQTINVTPTGATLGPPVSTPTSSGQMVTMRAPTGETSQVPASAVAHYTQMGAQVVH